MKNNLIIIGDREIGKTTFLLSKVDEYVNQGKNIFILDSATEHMNKSLLKKVQRKYKNAVTFDLRNEDRIILSDDNENLYIKNFINYFPYKELIQNKGKIICFDLSYFLEKGHDIYDETKDEKAYKYYRKLYNYLSQQIVFCLILCQRNGIIKNPVVVMDEIELPKVCYDMALLQDDINFIASIHPENAFGTFYDSFEKIDFKPYIKRKGRE